MYRSLLWIIRVHGFVPQCGLRVRPPLSSDWPSSGPLWSMKRCSHVYNLWKLHLLCKERSLTYAWRNSSVCSLTSDWINSRGLPSTVHIPELIGTLHSNKVSIYQSVCACGSLGWVMASGFKLFWDKLKLTHLDSTHGCCTGPTNTEVESNGSALHIRSAADVFWRKKNKLSLLQFIQSSVWFAFLFAALVCQIEECVHVRFPLIPCRGVILKTWGMLWLFFKHFTHTKIFLICRLD